MTTPLSPDKALYLPIEIISEADFGPFEITLGTQTEDDDGNLQYDDNGNPSQTVYDLSGYSVTTEINSTTSAASAAFTVDDSDLEDGKFSLSLTDTQTATLAGWKTTSKSTEKVANYRVYLTLGAITKVKLYGPISINVLGA